MPLLADLGTRADGTVANISLEDALRYLRDNYLANEGERQRRALASRRQELYQDGGERILSEDINAFFSDPRVRELRRRFVEAAKYNNVTKRVINTVSTVYQRSARRSVAGDASDARYQALLRATRHDQVMRRSNRLTNLHGQTLLGFRVRQSDRAPVSEVVTPDRFYAVAHPLDRTLMVAVVIDLEPMLISPQGGDPRYVVWTDSERFMLSAGGTLVADSFVENRLGRIPWLLVSVEPTLATLLDSTRGEDLVAAHRSSWFQEVLLLKESKSANRQVLLSGDLQSTPSGQTADSETDGIVGEDVTVQTVDRGLDLAQFRDNSNHIIEHCAVNWGIPPSVLRGEGATSGHEIELRRIEIRERRVEQEPVWRDIERDFAQLQAQILAVDAPDQAFFPDGWSLNFGETQTPQEPGARLATFEKERQLGVTNTLDLIRERDPDLTSDAQAAAILTKNIAVETKRVQLMQELQAMDAGMGTQTGEVIPANSASTPDISE